MCCQKFRRVILRRSSNFHRSSALVGLATDNSLAFCIFLELSLIDFIFFLFLLLFLLRSHAAGKRRSPEPGRAMVSLRPEAPTSRTFAIFGDLYSITISKKRYSLLSRDHSAFDTYQRKSASSVISHRNRHPERYKQKKRNQAQNLKILELAMLNIICEI